MGGILREAINRLVLFRQAQTLSPNFFAPPEIGGGLPEFSVFHQRAYLSPVNINGT